MKRKSERGKSANFFGGREIFLMANLDYCRDYEIDYFYCEGLPEASRLEEIKGMGLIVAASLQDPRDALKAAYFVDMLYLNWDLFSCSSLLKEIGRTGAAVVIERGPAATIKEVLERAIFMREAGSREVIICAGGIRSFEYPDRSPLDLSAVPVWKHMGDFPVIVNPGRFDKVYGTAAAMARAAVAAGADGLFFIDLPQKECLRSLLEELRQVAFAMGRRVSCREKEKNDRNYTLEVRKGVANFDY